MKRASVCLVTSAHVSYNPRLTKEADSLAEAGYDVRVVAMNVEKWRARVDDDLMRSRSWSLHRINGRRDELGGVFRSGIAALRQKYHILLGPSADAYSRYNRQLFNAVVRTPADLYIAHNLPALAATAQAARYHKAKLGFDAEDFHRGEYPEVEKTAPLRALTAWVEEKYIPQCDYVTAASGGIADAYAEVLKIPRPIPILNVFSRDEREGTTPAPELASERKGDGISLYWYSQVIGPDRGLGDALAAAGLLKPRVRLHVRGAWSSVDYRQAFERETRELGIEDRVHTLSPVSPVELIERAAQHDVGLALEPGDRLNNRLATSNKLFGYMVAGLAIAATDVEGQSQVLRPEQEAAFLYPPGDAQTLAAKLTTWLDNPQALARARQRSRSLAETRYCWEIESGKFLGLIAGVLGHPK
jgi:glycosyltransferase involved in cell wall biosynthesis